MRVSEIIFGKGFTISSPTPSPTKALSIPTATELTTPSPQSSASATAAASLMSDASSPTSAPPPLKSPCMSSSSSSASTRSRNRPANPQPRPPCRESIRRARSLPIADELHSFILEHYKTQRPASNVAQALVCRTVNSYSLFLLFAGLGGGVLGSLDFPEDFLSLGFPDDRCGKLRGKIGLHACLLRCRVRRDRRLSGNGRHCLDSYCLLSKSHAGSIWCPS